MGILWVTAVGRHWGSAPDHTQHKAVFRNLGRLKGDGESKRTWEAWQSPAGVPQCRDRGRWGPRLTPATLEGTARHAEAQDNNGRQTQCSSNQSGETPSLLSLLTTPFPSTSKQSHLRMQMQLAGHTWRSSSTGCQA